MFFNSYAFIFAFLPVTLIIYYSLIKRNNAKVLKLWLLIISFAFYMFLNIKYIPIILLSLIINFGINYLFRNLEKLLLRKSILLFGVMFNIGVLLYFKYFNFFIGNINLLFSQSFNLKTLIIPIGISFFTFQQISYIIDSYYGKILKCSLLDYSLYVMFFPKIIQGPIVKYNDLILQFDDKENLKLNCENLAKGVYIFSIGLIKKIIVADTLGKAVDIGFSGVDNLNTTNAILVILSYTMQIYFDFSGYCDMANGIALMFNIKLPVNFNSPYKALNIFDFWKRWHITLTRFFTNYVYIPLGGNRKGTIREYINVVTIFLISGFWHGANWTFILWGLLHGIALVIYKILKKNIDELHPALNWLMTFGFVNLSWVYFRADSISQGTLFIKQILRFNFGPINGDIANCFILPEFNFITDILGVQQAILQKSPYIYIILFLLIILVGVLAFKNTNEELDNFKPNIKNGVITAIFILWAIISLSSVTTFIYVNF